MKKKLPITKNTVIHVWQESPQLILMQIPGVTADLPLNVESAQALLDDLTKILQDSETEHAIPT